MSAEANDLIRLILQIGQFAAMVVVAVYSWVLSRTKANKDAIAKVDNRVQGIERRLERVESDIHNLPSHSEIAALHEKINRVAAAQERNNGVLTGIQSTLHLIHQSLLDERKKP